MAEIHSTDYAGELERRARAEAETQFQAAFSAVCRTFNLVGSSDRYTYSTETTAEVERILSRLMCLMSDAPIKPNPAAYVSGDPAFRQFMTTAKRKPRKTRKADK